MNAEEIRLGLDFSKLSEAWCNEILKDDFCSSTWPSGWEYDESLLGLETHFQDLLTLVQNKRHNFWDSFVLTDVAKLQCITNIVLESCINSEGSIFTGLLCGACYIRISALDGASARNVYHSLLFGKVLELLKVQDDPSLFPGVRTVYDSLSALLHSEMTLQDQSYWLVVKSVLSSVNNNCSHKKVKNESFDAIFECIITKPEDFKYFIKESLVYLLSGKSYVSDRCTIAILKCMQDNLEDSRVIDHNLNLVKNLCTQISDRTEVRKQVEVYILKLLRALPHASILQFLNWVVSQLCWSSKVVHRIFGVDMCFQMSFIENVSDDPELITLLFHTITRSLSDKAPTVRAKSSMVLSDLLKNTQECIHKSLVSFFDINEETNIIETVVLLSSDEKSSVRKAICHLLLMMLLKIKLKSSWIKLIYRLSLDTAVSVRKQALTSVVMLMDEDGTKPVVQRLWLETILPGINDNENSVKDLCITQLKTVLNSLDNDNCWAIVELIADPKSIDLQVYFDCGIKHTHDYEASDSTKDILITKLSEPTSSATALLVISKIVNQFTEGISSNTFLDIFNDSAKNRSDESYQTMCMALNCIRSLKEVEDIEVVVTTLNEELLKYSHPYLVIREIVRTLANLGHKSDIERFRKQCRDSVTHIANVLQKICLSRLANVQLTSMKLSCYLFTLGELSLHISDSIDSHITLSLKELIIDNEDSAFSTSVRAHAIITLGKFCLIHEEIAKDSVMLLSRVLENDKSCEVRNNILIVLSDLIVRYPTMVAEYLYCVTDCLQDESCVVRRQAIIVLTKLLQEDYLKWRSAIVMKFIANLVDDDAEIRQLCELCLSNILLVRYPKTYFDFFIEVVFFVNGLLSFIAVSEPNLRQFSLPGTENETKRRRIYSAMLQNLSDQQKLDVTTRVCKEILTLFISENENPIETKLIPLLQDTLWILCCPSLKLTSLKARACSDFDEDDSIIEKIQAQTKVISNIVKQNFVENCTPIIIHLRQKLKKMKSPLQQDLTKFIVSFMSDYKNEIEIVLSGADSEFVAEVQYDIDEFNKETQGLIIKAEFHKVIDNNLVTPKFLKMFKTPQTSGRSVNLHLANGPAGFFNSPFYCAPTPFSVSRNVLHNNLQQPNELRKNLLEEFSLAPSGSKSNSKLPKIAIIPTIGAKSQITPTRLDQSDHEVSFNNKIIQEEVSVKIINSPASRRERDVFEDAATVVVGIKDELLSPQQAKQCVLPIKRVARNLYNPAAAADLQNASSMSMNSTNAGASLTKTPTTQLLLNKKAGFVKLVKCETAKRALALNYQTLKAVQEAASEDDPEQAKNDKPADKAVKKPILLGKLIKEKLRERRREKAEQAKAAEAETKLKSLRTPKPQLIVPTTSDKSHVSKQESTVTTVVTNVIVNSEELQLNSEPTKPTSPTISHVPSVFSIENEATSSAVAIECDRAEEPKATDSQLLLTQPELTDAPAQPTSDPDDTVVTQSEPPVVTSQCVKVHDAGGASKPADAPILSQPCDLIKTVTKETDDQGLKVGSAGTLKCHEHGSGGGPSLARDLKTDENIPKTKPMPFSQLIRRTKQSRKSSRKSGITGGKTSSGSKSPIRKGNAAPTNENTPPRNDDKPKSLDKMSPNEKSGETKNSEPEQVLKQCQSNPNVSANDNPVSENIKHTMEKPNKPKITSSRRVRKLMAQFQPKNIARDNDNIVDKPENILLTNQVLRKRKLKGEEGHCVYQEDDLLPKAKRRSIDDVVKLGNITFDQHDPKMCSSTPAPSGRRASLRLLQKPSSSKETAEITFDQNDPQIVSSTPFLGKKKGLVSSTPAVQKSRSQPKLDCNLSPITETKKG